ncbi:hypothetical protein GGQ64_003313 [Rhizobium azooxidifex]|uniref:Uncharacterized protein n=1 Tax=Mycoplana azooxidifex TaxID=1636188 RepID=A0A7W6D8W0_9HYPH|nr:hypothetical protein [Mycoplana azooxidifex]MBB3978099.1 hypothetical protein [Mycoplana azooxidifex]
MNTKPIIAAPPTGRTQENVAYIRQMLGELRAVANMEGAEMLRYLIEMAYVEAGDIQAGLRPLSIGGNRDKAAGVTVKSAGKVQF